jgi:hypothetical protein
MEEGVNHFDSCLVPSKRKCNLTSITWIILKTYGNWHVTVNASNMKFVAKNLTQTNIEGYDLP